MTVLRLASAAEGRAILEAEDDFTRALGAFDRSFRMRTVESAADADVRRFLGEQAVDFTAEEAAIWEAVLEAVARGSRGIGGLLPSEVLVVKTTGREERDHAYTRANAIFLPAARVARLRGDRAIYLLAHELFHVASRASAPLRDATYSLLGFAPIAPIAPPPELDAKRMTNPDAFSLDHWTQVTRASSNDVIAVMPLLTCPLPLAEVINSTSVVGTMEVSLLAIDPDTAAVVRDETGAPVVIPATNTDWSRRLARNTKYTIHPEEVLADNYALLVRSRLDLALEVPEPAFLDAFAESVRRCTE